MYGRVTAVMEWIVEHIQDGECHYVQKYIDESISNQRKKESNKIKRLERALEKMKNKKEKEIDDEKWEEIAKVRWPCKCPYCSPELDYNQRITKFKKESCFEDEGRYMTSFRNAVLKSCGYKYVKLERGHHLVKLAKVKK